MTSSTLPWFLRAVGAVAGLAGSVVLLAMVVTTIHTVSFRMNAERTSAVVVGHEPYQSCMHRGSGGGTCSTEYRPVVTFTVAGRTYQVTEGAGDADRSVHPVGSHNDVVYDPSDPSGAHFPHKLARDVAPIAVWSVIGGGLVAFAAGLFWYARRTARNRVPAILA